MSERLTLEQLKAMNDGELFDHWMAARFPFESLDGCTQCLTSHGVLRCEKGLHPQIVSQIDALEGKLILHKDNMKWLRANLEALYALRLFYDKFYARHKQVEPAEPEVAQPESVQTEAAHA